MKILGTSILTWLICIVMTAKSLKAQNCQKFLKLVIFRDSIWRFTIGIGHETCLFMLYGKHHKIVENWPVGLINVLRPVRRKTMFSAISPVPPLI